MKGKKTHSIKMAEAKTMKLSDPELSLRDIEKDLGISRNVVAKAIDELGQVVTTEKGKELFDYNLEIINIGAKKVAKAMQTMDPEDIREAKEMQAIVETAFKQNQLIQGKATSRIAIDVKDVEKKTDQELDAFIKSKLNE